MFTNKLKEVLAHEGVVSITTWANNSAHVSNTWNSYLKLDEDRAILIPAAWMNKTEQNIQINDRIILTFGSKEVEGTIGMGAGFVVEGKASFMSNGDKYDLMKEAFPFLSKLLQVVPTEIRQTI